MTQKKVCMLGAFAVGKTSLVSRFVHSTFSEKYHTTVGVKVDRHAVNVDGRDLSLILWDLHGEDDFESVRQSYLRGSAGFLLVVDPTRSETMTTALTVRENNDGVLGDLPFIVVLNKSDLKTDWELDEDVMGQLADLGAEFIEASAKTGDGVETAFISLSRSMLGGRSVGQS